MASLGAKSPTEIPQGESDTEHSEFDYELHYDLHGESLQSILGEILKDSSPSKHIHSGDKKLLPSPVHAMARVGAKYLRESAAGILVAHSTVEEVLPTSWTDCRDAAAMQGTNDIDYRLFFTKVITAEMRNFKAFQS